jgi:hypothetical protein
MSDYFENDLIHPISVLKKTQDLCPFNQIALYVTVLYFTGTMDLFRKAWQRNAQITQS